MNFQPPDPPEFGHCLSCKRHIHLNDERGDQCMDCCETESTAGADENGIRPAISEDGAYRFNPWTGQHE
ncbi:hypothetical protein SAMN05216597_2119 [Pseudomonas cannabina]|nr:hypothetical protein SAMN05216597_2119 [Pseudomonas cannabina]